MKRVIRNRLCVRDFEGLARFYGDLLGMTRYGAGRGHEVFGYDGDQCCLEFIPTAKERHTPNPDDFYWKFGITLGNLDAAPTARQSQQHEQNEAPAHGCVS